MDLFLRETSDRIGRDDPLFRIELFWIGERFPHS